MPLSIGERIKFLREKNNMTLEYVAKHLNIGRSTVFKYESGEVTNIPSDKIEILARLFNVSPAYLMGWTEPDAEPPDIPRTQEARILSKGIDKMPKEQREQAIAVMKAVFSQYSDYFDKGDSDET